MPPDPSTKRPILWSFRRCPYAIRARLAVRASGVAVELREILLRDKPQAFLETSASATVPALRTETVILDESLDIMIWALRQSDPTGLLNMPDKGWELIKANDGPFKSALDHTKYAVRFADRDMAADRAEAGSYLATWNAQLEGQEWLFGDDPRLADLALLPFVRQFANTDRAWFDAQPWPNLQRWLERFLASDDFAAIMLKYPVWTEGQPPNHFP